MLDKGVSYLERKGQNNTSIESDPIGFDPIGFGFTLVALVLIVCLNSPLLNAESIEEFCLTQDIDITKHGYTTKNLSAEKYPNTIELTAGEKKFFLVKDPYRGNLTIRLKDEQDNELWKYYYRQAQTFDEGDLINIALDKHSWLWVHGRNYEYYTHIDTSTVPPTISEPETVSKISGLRASCSLISQFLYGCDSDGISTYFSKVLGRLFVFGSPPVATKMVEIIDGKPRDLPDELQQAYLNKKKKLVAYDLPALGGVLFKGGLGRALFYDGEKVTSLLDSTSYENKSTWFPEIESGGKHVYLNIKSYGKYYLVRIEPDLSLTQLSLPSGTQANARFEIKQFPQFPLILFWKYFTSFERLQESLNIEIGSSLHTVIVITKSIKLSRIKYFKNALKDGLVLDAYNAKTKQPQKYFIVHASSSAQCIAKLDPDNPIILRAE